MSMEKKKWLPHVTNEIVKGSRNRLSAYLIALEGWRRGLKLTWYSRKVKNNKVHAPGRLFSLSSEDKTHFFYNSRGDLTKPIAQKITGNKDLTKDYLKKGNVDFPKGKRFTEKHSIDEIVQYANKLDYPLVLKPTKGYQGRGVLPNLKDESELRNALDHLRNELGYSDVIVEEFINGVEYRVFVIDTKIIGAVKKIPPNIIGNGQDTIGQLIKEKNKQKRKNPHLYKKPIKIDYEVLNCIEQSGYTLSSVLKKGERIFLRNKNSLSSGGDPVDATDELSTKAKRTSVNALKAIPNLEQAGIDIIVNEETNRVVVLELNAIAMIGSHLFPEEGVARDVPKAIIDHYFPETVNSGMYNSDVYFDLRAVLRPLISKIANLVEVTPAPMGDLYSTQYIVKGKVQGVRYRKWIQRRALEHDLYGFAQNLADGSVKVVVYGERVKVNDFKNICKQGPKNAVVTDIEQKPWNRPIKVGFEIKDSQKKKGVGRNNNRISFSRFRKLLLKIKELTK